MRNDIPRLTNSLIVGVEAAKINHTPAIRMDGRYDTP